MANQPPFQEQRTQQTDSGTRTAKQPASRQTQPLFDAVGATNLGEEVVADKASGAKMGLIKATAGVAGEHNLSLEWINVGRAARFNVKTVSANTLEVLTEQLAYKKTYSETGVVHTQVIPFAPIGTKGKLIARDTVTGETLEQPWTWVLLGGGGGRQGVFSWLWDALKRSLWKSAN